MDFEVSEEVISTLRKISRAVELYSRILFREYGLTGPQLTILTVIFRSGPLAVTDIARRVSLSQATVTNILGRLEQQGFVLRARSTQDRRMVYIQLTDKTREILERNPSPLHTDFLGRFDRLQDWEKTLLLSSLQRIAQLMEVEQLEEPDIEHVQGKISADAQVLSRTGSK
jgi:DNA-binding MarR family transcriptional regulator